MMKILIILIMAILTSGLMIVTHPIINPRLQHIIKSKNFSMFVFLLVVVFTITLGDWFVDHSNYFNLSEVETAGMVFIGQAIAGVIVVVFYLAAKILRVNHKKHLSANNRKKSPTK